MMFSCCCVPRKQKKLHTKDYGEMIERQSATVLCNSLTLRQSDNYHILCVEDNNTYQALLKNIFRKLGAKFRCTCVSTVASAKKHLQDPGCHVDLIIMDRLVEDGSADELTMQFYKQYPIILLSRLDNLLEIEKFRSLGICYVNKPINIQNFSSMLRELFPKEKKMDS